MVAIRDGAAQEISTGFTSLEGIISKTGCGDIDPTVVFQLYSTGMSFKAINKLLSAESGFRALAGGKAGFSDILGKVDSPKEIALVEIYCYNVLSILAGLFLRLEGGCDSIYW